MIPQGGVDKHTNLRQLGIQVKEVKKNKGNPMTAS